eukprot:TRINITY_DN13655_c0_g1_i2.p1 TRINITY_DN13655_c0_g1~~TRINITY_DN13655_c0_g1_i2.p1  ORF type:complete len:232 (+),score=43.76 TRINITY_DN13655_c0_g1_i2:31-726(+)
MSGGGANSAGPGEPVGPSAQPQGVSYTRREFTDFVKRDGLAGQWNVTEEELGKVTGAELRAVMAEFAEDPRGLAELVELFRRNPELLASVIRGSRQRHVEAVADTMTAMHRSHGDAFWSTADELLRDEALDGRYPHDHLSGVTKHVVTAKAAADRRAELSLAQQRQRQASSRSVSQSPDPSFRPTPCYSPLAMAQLGDPKALSDLLQLPPGLLRPDAAGGMVPFADVPPSA